MGMRPKNNSNSNDFAGAAAMASKLGEEGVLPSQQQPQAAGTGAFGLGGVEPAQRLDGRRGIQQFAIGAATASGPRAVVDDVGEEQWHGVQEAEEDDPLHEF